MLNGKSLITSWATLFHWAYRGTGTGSTGDPTIHLNTRFSTYPNPVTNLTSKEGTFWINWIWK